MKITLYYTTFALIATLLNIGAQELFIRAYQGSYNIEIAIGVGTVIGLASKYLLDKKYIFNFTPVNRNHSRDTFLIYCTMGVVTTAIFWGFEYSFNELYDSKEMRYLGGVIGLSIGYYIKYQLDKRYVFIHSRATV